MFQNFIAPFTSDEWVSVEYWWNDADGGRRSAGNKTCSTALLSPQMVYGLSRNWTWFSADRLIHINTTEIWANSVGGVHLDIKGTWPLGTGGVKGRNLWTVAFSVVGLHLRSVVVNLEVNDPVNCVDCGTVGRKGSRVAVFSLSIMCCLEKGYGHFGRKSCLLLQGIYILFSEIVVTAYQILWRREPEHQSKNVTIKEAQNPYERIHFPSSSIWKKYYYVIFSSLVRVFYELRTKFLQVFCFKVETNEA